jgi:putative salt-induced outer membrane protein
MLDKTISSTLLAALGMLAMNGSALADWSGEGDLGMVVARGNTDTDTISAKLAIKKTQDEWEHNAGLAFLRSTNAGVTSAERFALTGQSDYAIDEHSYYFGSLRYEDDKFSGFDYQSSATVGYGRKFIDTEVATLKGELGVGYRQTKLETFSSEGDAILRAAMNYTRNLTDTTSFSNDTLVESGSNNTFAQNITGLSVRINDSLAMKVGFEVRYNSEAPLGLKSTDTITTLNLNYKF